MLSDTQLEHLLSALDTPEPGRKLIRAARKDSPVRQVKSTGSNVLTSVASRKMCRAIATESRKVEYVAAIEHEVNPDVLEYFPQPGTYKLELLDPDTGEVHAIEHTPDFLVVQKHAVRLQEWKSEERLVSLALRFPWRYQKLAGVWRSPQIEDHFADLGIQYELHSSAEIHPNRTKNFEILFDYFDVDAPSVEESIAARLRTALEVHGSLSLLDLQSEPFHFSADDLLKSIADGRVAFDLDIALLSDIYNFRVYRDEALLQLDQAFNQESVVEFDSSFSVTLSPGSQFLWEGHLLELAIVGQEDLLFTAPDDKRTFEFTKDWLLTSLKAGKVKQIKGSSMACQTSSLQPLLVYSKEELQQAQLRSQWIALPYHETHTSFSLRTYYRLQAAQAEAIANGTNEVLALAPKHHLKGNREPRLSDEQRKAMEHIWKTEYKTDTCKSAASVFRELQAYCTEHCVVCPSYPTFNQFIKANEDHATRVVRTGRRMAYQNATFYTHLAYDTPIHGVRPFEYVHIDHTQVDVELLDRRTGKPLGRPFLTLMIDACSRRIMAFHLGFHAPGRAEVLMCFRAFVMRWSRIPFITICDNGRDLIANDVQSLIQNLGGQFRRRPAGQPRAGSVMERIFGTANSQLFHNLKGNTKLTLEIRKLSGSHLPERLANWGLKDLYNVFEGWAFKYYDNLKHPALDMSPREAFEKGLRETGQRPHKMIVYGDDFIIATCPTVDRKGVRKVDRQRGVKVNGFYYQSPLFDTMRLHSKTVPVRFDPNDIGRVFFQLPNREWAQAHSMQLVSLPRLNLRQLQALSEEYRAVHKHSSKSCEISGERLVEFIASMKVDEGFAKEIQRTGETEKVQEEAGLLATAPAGLGSKKPYGIDGIQNHARRHISGVQDVSAVEEKREDSSQKKGKSTTAQQSTGGNTDFIFGELD